MMKRLPVFVLLCCLLVLLCSVFPFHTAIHALDAYTQLQDNSGNHYGKNTPTPIPTFIPPPTATPTPLVEISSTPTPRALPHGKKQFFSRGSGMTPSVTQGYLDPYDPAPDSVQTVNVSISDTSAVVSASVIITTDTRTTQLPLERISGTETSGSWSGSWTVNDSYGCTYLMMIQATDMNGSLSQTTLTLR